MKILSRLRSLASKRKGDRAAAVAVPAATTSKVGDVAICIPHDSLKGVSLVLGVDWSPHLTREVLFTAASKMAKANGYTHVYTRPKGGGDFFGVVKIAEKDSKTYSEMVPVAVAFAKQVPDKNARSLYIVDGRAPNEPDGDMYAISASRGNPTQEVLVSAGKALELLHTWSADSRSGTNVFVDTPDRNFYELVSDDFPTASELPLYSIAVDKADQVRKPPAVNITKSHLVLGGLGLAGLLVYQYGIDYYDTQVRVKADKDVQQQMVAQYIASRKQEFEAGYGSTTSGGLAAVMHEIRMMPLMRNGWEFSEASCLIEQASCTITWRRVYGTYDAFLESASANRISYDAADYRSIKESRPFAVPIQQKPAFDALPGDVDFVKDNGDRADTFQLAGVAEYSVGQLEQVGAWGGKGVPPGPVIVSAKWAFEASIDMTEEAVNNARLGSEFGLGSVLFTLKNGEILVKLEGKVYARKS